MGQTVEEAQITVICRPFMLNLVTNSPVPCPIRLVYGDPFLSM